MTTANSVNTGLSGQSGTGNFVGNSQPTLNQAVLNGRTDGSEPGAGAIGQTLIASVAPGSAVSLTTGTAAEVTKVTLTAGNWYVTGTVGFSFDVTTTVTGIAASVRDTVTIGTGQDGGTQLINASLTTGADQALFCGEIYVQTTMSLDIHLVARASFAVSTAAAYGIIKAIRVS